MRQGGWRGGRRGRPWRGGRGDRGRFDVRRPDMSRDNSDPEGDIVMDEMGGRASGRR